MMGEASFNRPETGHPTVFDELISHAVTPLAAVYRRKSTMGGTHTLEPGLSVYSEYQLEFTAAAEQA